MLTVQFCALVAQTKNPTDLCAAASHFLCGTEQQRWVPKDSRLPVFPFQEQLKPAAEATPLLKARLSTKTSRAAQTQTSSLQHLLCRARAPSLHSCFLLGRQSLAVMRSLQPLQLSDPDSPLCCRATSPVTHTRTRPTRTHAPHAHTPEPWPLLLQTFLTPLQGGGPSLEASERSHWERLFCSCSPVTLLSLLMPSFSWIRCPGSQSSTEESPCRLQTRRGEP